jgi:hypothetical protein
MKNKYKIKIHSFVDLITNSSTEIYIEATSHTTKAIKEIVDNILKIGGSSLTCDDLFDITLDDEDAYENEYGYKDVSLIVKAKDENSELGKTTAKLLANLTGIFSIEACDNY